MCIRREAKRHAANMAGVRATCVKIVEGGRCSEVSDPGGSSETKS